MPAMRNGKERCFHQNKWKVQIAGTVNPSCCEKVAEAFCSLAFFFNLATPLSISPPVIIVAVQRMQWIDGDAQTHIWPSKLLCYQVLHPIRLNTNQQRPERMGSLSPLPSWQRWEIQQQRLNRNERFAEHCLSPNRKEGYHLQGALLQNLGLAWVCH